MFEYTYNDESIAGHGLTRQDVHQALDDPARMKIPQKESNRGNQRAMFIGETETSTLLQVGVEYLSVTKWHIYHCDKANADQKKIYRGGGKRQ